ncbi:MAG: hypothetical protein U9Q81_03535 [Pseudomonadota bacterium]|nr:hypothetical protein [Pseudomonadota bacterium]
MRPILDIAAERDLSPEDLMVYGGHMAKLEENREENSGRTLRYPQIIAL